MRRRLVILVVVLLLSSLVVAAPANAGFDDVIRGDIDLSFVGQVCPDGRFNTWTGTVVIDGTTYGWADFPTADLVEKGRWIYFEEYWTIFAVSPGDSLNDLACDASKVVLDGTNVGLGTPWNTGFAWGTVGASPESGPFEDVDAGSRMFWRGEVSDDQMEFTAKLRIYG